MSAHNTTDIIRQLTFNNVVDKNHNPLEYCDIIEEIESIATEEQCGEIENKSTFFINHYPFVVRKTIKRKRKQHISYFDLLAYLFCLYYCVSKENLHEEKILEFQPIAKKHRETTECAVIINSQSIIPKQNITSTYHIITQLTNNNKHLLSCKNDHKYYHFEKSSYTDVVNNLQLPVLRKKSLIKIPPTIKKTIAAPKPTPPQEKNDNKTEFKYPDYMNYILQNEESKKIPEEIPDKIPELQYADYSLFNPDNIIKEIDTPTLNYPDFTLFMFYHPEPTNIAKAKNDPNVNTTLNYPDFCLFYQPH